MSESCRFRAEVVGSLLRPAELLQARRRRQRLQISESELRKLEDEAVKSAIALQETAGLDIVTDGELRRELFVGNLAEKLDGVSSAPGLKFLWRGNDALQSADVVQSSPMVVVDKLRRRESLFAEELVFACGHANKPLKVTLPSPLTLAFLWHPRVSTNFYRDPFDMFEDFARILRAEIVELRNLGCRNIQIDAPEVATLVDPGVRRFWKVHGIDPDRMLADGIELIDSVVRDIDHVRFSIHLCRGNNSGHYLASGGYDGISKTVFGRLPSFDALLLEYDSKRCGDFEALKDVPRGPAVVLGLVSTMLGEIESSESIAGLIRQASRVIDAERLALSTQCGFASIAAASAVSEEAQFRKLKLVADVAHAVLP